MYLSWLGLNCFKIQTQNCTIITDPYGQATGLKLPRLQADVVTTTQKNDPQFNASDKIGGQPFLIDGPGEYERKRIYIQGVADQINSQSISANFLTLYYFEIEDIGLTHLGAINHPLTDKELEIFEGTDVLLLPIGGKPALTPEKAVEVISQIEPRIVIPMYYKTPGLKLNLNPLTKFLQTMGIKNPEELPKIKLQKRDLPQEETKVIILKP